MPNYIISEGAHAQPLSPPLYMLMTIQNTNLKIHSEVNIQKKKMCLLKKLKLTVFLSNIFKHFKDS